MHYSSRLGWGVLQAARIAELEEHLKSLEVEQASAEAKHRLYHLLYERTRCAPCSEQESQKKPGDEHEESETRQH